MIHDDVPSPSPCCIHGVQVVGLPMFNHSVTAHLSAAIITIHNPNPYSLKSIALTWGCLHCGVGE